MKNRSGSRAWKRGRYPAEVNEGFSMNSKQEASGQGNEVRHKIITPISEKPSQQIEGTHTTRRPGASSLSSACKLNAPATRYSIPEDTQEQAPNAHDAFAGDQQHIMPFTKLLPAYLHNYG